MPTFSCPQCGAVVTASHKPSACRQCGGRQIRTNRNHRGSLSSNVPPPRSQGTAQGGPPGIPVNDPLKSAESRAAPLENSLNPPKPERRSNSGLGFNIFSPSLIMTWLLVLLPLAAALGFSFYRLATFQLTTTDTDQDSQTYQDNQTGQNGQQSQANQQAQPMGISPQMAIAKYYQDLNQQPDTDGWQWVFRTEIYDTKILQETPVHTAIQVGPRYHLHNGEKICESRVFTLTPDDSRHHWHISDPKAIRSQPNCTL